MNLWARDSAICLKPLGHLLSNMGTPRRRGLCGHFEPLPAPEFCLTTQQPPPPPLQTPPL